MGIYDFYGNEITTEGKANIGGYIIEPEYKTVNGNKYRLTWEDDFDGKDINHNFWSEYYCISNVTNRYLARADYYMGNSCLNLRIKPDSLGRHSGDSASITRAMSGIQTGDVNGKASQQIADAKHDINPFWGLISYEGYYECRFKLSDAFNDHGRHFAWWANEIKNYNTSDGDGSEIDFCEIGMVNHGGTDSVPHGVHKLTGDATTWYNTTPIDVDFNTDFHTLGVLWENGVMRWYVDDVLIDTKSNITTPQKPMMFFLTIYDAVSGQKWSEDMIANIDYFKIYKPITTEVSSNVHITGFEPISINGSTADMTIDLDRGCPNAFPQWCRINWSDGSKTEHWVQWDQLTTTWQSNITNQTNFIWTGHCYDIGYDVSASVAF